MYVSRAIRNVEVLATSVTLLEGPTPGEGQTRTESIRVYNISDATGRLLVTHVRAGNNADIRIMSDPVTAGDFWELPHQIQLEQGDSITARVAVLPSKPWQAAVEYTWQDFGAPSLAALFVAANNEFLSRADVNSMDMGDIDMSLIGIFRVDDDSADAHLMGKWTETGNMREYRLFFKTADKKVYFQVSNDGTAVVEVATTLVVTEAVWFHIYAYHDATGNVIGISLDDATANTTAHTTGIFSGTAATGTITVVSGANTADGDDFTIDDGTASINFEFDDDVTITGDVAVTFTGSETDEQMRDLVIQAINDSASTVVASINDTAVIDITHDAKGIIGNETILEAVINAGFLVSGMSGGVGADYRMGSDGDGADDFDGLMSSAAIWKRLLTDAERTWVYNSGFGRDPNDYGLPVTDGGDLLTSNVDGWPLSEASGNRGSIGSLTLTDNASVLSAAGVPK